MEEGSGGGDRDAQYSSTVDDPDLYCLPCYRAEGQKEDAVGYCQDCSEHLCKVCYKVHCRNKHTAHHVLLDQHHMPKYMSTTLTPTPVSSEVTCVKHNKEFIKFFCSDHEVVLCSVCSTLNHRQCKMEYIPDYAASYLNSERGRTKLTRIQAILQSCDRVKKATQKQLEDAETNALQAIEDLDLQRNTMIAAIEKEFEDLKDTAVKFRNERRTMAGEMLQQSDKIQTDVRGIESNVDDIKTDKSNKDELFIQLMQSQTFNLDIYEKQIKELENTKLTSEIRFTPNAELSFMAKRNLFLGRMSTESLSDETKATKIREVNVKASEDGSQCSIQGIETLSNGILALTDWYNKSVKTVNITSGEILNVQQLSFNPGDLTVVPGNKLAVTLSDGSAIQFISTERDLALGDSITCKAAPHGIVYHKDQLVVSFDSPTNKAEILSLTGDVIRSFSPGLYYPLYVTVSNDSHILISDYSNSRVLRLDWTGRDCGAYRDADLTRPLGIAVCGDGKFIISSSDTNSVHLVSEKCKKITTLLNEKDGVKEPKVCCYDETRRLLYVSFTTSTDQDNNIAVYQLM